MSISQTSANSFSSLSLQDVVDIFNLEDSQNLFFPTNQFYFDKVQMSKFLSKISNQVDYWTEQELIMKHIAPILNLVDMTGSNYNTFAGRPIGAKVGDYEMSGYVDFLVAKGKYEPTQPYFFIHEFKKGLNQNGDPFGQLLGEMLVAQVINNDNLVYGLVIVGRLWHFVVLKGKEFTRISPLDSLDIIDLQIIFDRLSGVKQYIEDKLR